MDNEVGTSSARRQFVAGALHITIGESESLAGLPQTKTGKHQFLGAERISSSRVQQNYHTVKFSEQRIAVIPGPVEKILQFCDAQLQLPVSPAFSSFLQIGRAH